VGKRGALLLLLLLLLLQNDRSNMLVLQLQFTSLVPLLMLPLGSTVLQMLQQAPSCCLVWPHCPLLLLCTCLPLLLLLLLLLLLWHQGGTTRAALTRRVAEEREWVVKS
jgi:hypothetical protein